LTFQQHKADDVDKFVSSNMSCTLKHPLVGVVANFFLPGVPGCFLWALFPPVNLRGFNVFTFLFSLCIAQKTTLRGSA